MKVERELSYNNTEKLRVMLDHFYLETNTKVTTGDDGRTYLLSYYTPPQTAADIDRLLKFAGTKGLDEVRLSKFAMEKFKIKKSMPVEVLDVIFLKDERDKARAILYVRGQKSQKIEEKWADAFSDYLSKISVVLTWVREEDNFKWQD